MSKLSYLICHMYKRKVQEKLISYLNLDQVANPNATPTRIESQWFFNSFRQNVAQKFHIFWNFFSMQLGIAN
jgi:hypothetical protein